MLGPAEGAYKNIGVRVTRAVRAPSIRFADIIRLIEPGKLRPAVYQVFPLSEARQAQELCETRHGRGHIVLRIAG